jgi:peptidoglycan biosynthesis protein MviN/MurJ (putative lipid II flippase)
MLLHLGLSALLIISRPHGGLALATSLAAYFNLVGLLVRLRQHLAPMQGRSVLHSALQALGGSVIIAMLTGQWGEVALQISTSGTLRALALGSIVLEGIVRYSGRMLLWRSEDVMFPLEMGRRWWRRR